MLSQAQAKTILVRLGFRVNTTARYTQALRDFQGGWNLGTKLKIDGKFGPKTSAALARSEQLRQQGRPTASANFSFKEFQCHCGGAYRACRRIAGEGPRGHGWHVLRTLLQSLEILRKAEYKNGMTIISGFRCDGHNKAVDGASSSQHRFGAAADIPRAAATREVAVLHKFAGIGYKKSNGLVQHVDRRDLTGINPTRGTTLKPTTWIYS